MQLLSLDDLPAERRDGPFRVDDFYYNPHDQWRFDAFRPDGELGTDMVKTVSLRARSIVADVNWMNNSIPLHDGQLAMPYHPTPSGLIETVGRTPWRFPSERNNGISNRVRETEVGHVISLRPGTEKLFFDQVKGFTWNRVMHILLKMDLLAPGEGYGGKFAYFKCRPIDKPIGDFVETYLREFKVERYDDLVEVVTFRLLSEFSDRLGQNAVCSDGTPEVIFGDNVINNISIRVFSAYYSNCLTPRDSTALKRITAMFMDKLPDYGIQVDQHYCEALAASVLECFEKTRKGRT